MAPPMGTVVVRVWINGTQIYLILLNDRWARIPVNVYNQVDDNTQASEDHREVKLSQLWYHQSDMASDTPTRFLTELGWGSVTSRRDCESYKTVKCEGTSELWDFVLSRSEEEVWREWAVLTADRARFWLFDSQLPRIMGRIPEYVGFARSFI